MISDVILGRLSLVPIVTIAVPLIGPDGSATGVAGGSLDLSKFDRLVDGFRTLARPANHDRRSARPRDLFEQREPVIRPFRLGREELIAASRRPGRKRFPVSAPRTDKSGFRSLVATAAIEPAGWRVFVEQPLLTLRLQSTGYYAVTLRSSCWRSAAPCSARADSPAP